MITDSELATYSQADLELTIRKCTHLLIEKCYSVKAIPKTTNELRTQTT
ncbi:MAG: hypothetical protein ACREBJ_06590 [Nitrosotalea sp.]